MNRHVNACTKNYAKGKVDPLVKLGSLKFSFLFDFGQRVICIKGVESLTRKMRGPMFRLNSMELRWTIRFAKLNASNFRMIVERLLYNNYFSA